MNQLMVPDIGGNVMNSFATAFNTVDAANQRKKQNQLAALLPSALGGNQGSVNQLAAYSPELAYRIQQDQTKVAAERKKETDGRMRSDVVGAIASISSLPPDQRAGAYSMMVSGLKSRYPELAKVRDDYDEPSFKEFAFSLAAADDNTRQLFERVGVVPQEPAKALGPTELERNLSNPVTADWLRKQEENKGRTNERQPPSGYRWSGGNLTFIPGGPADPAVKRQGGGGIVVDPETGAITVSPQGFKPKPLPGELASRVALGESYAQQVPDILGAIDEGQTSGPLDRVGVLVGRGGGAAVARRQASGVDALIRNLTGAGMSMSEAEEYANRYRIQADDAVETQRNKVLQLVSELKNIDKTLKTQYGQTPSAAYEGIPSPPNLSDELGKQPASGGFKYLGRED